MSRVALILAVFGLLAFALPATSFAQEAAEADVAAPAEGGEAAEADVAAPAEGGEAAEGEAAEGEEAEATEGEEAAEPK